MTLPQLPAAVSSVRLRLPLVTPSQARDLDNGRQHSSFAPGFPRRDDLAAISLVRECDAATASWGPRLVIRAHDGLICGTIGFFGAPAPMAVDADLLEAEIGYGLVPEARGHGVGQEAVLALLAEADRVGVLVRASVEPTNRSSLTTLAACGFTELRGANEDGHLVMARPLGRGDQS